MFRGTDLGLQISAGHHLKTEAISDQENETSHYSYMVGRKKNQKVLSFATFIQILRTQNALFICNPARATHLTTYG